MRMPRARLSFGEEAFGGLARTGRSSAVASVRFFRSSALAAGSMAFLGAVVLVAIFADLLAPYGALQTNYDLLREGPSLSHIFGTDHLGRDLLSRVIIGTRITLLVAFISVAIGDAVGFSWGILSGYFGGKFDLISQRFLDVLFSFPSVILALLLLVALGEGVNTVIVAIAVTRVPGSTRVVRSVVLSVKEMSYVEAARAVGASPLRVMWLHISPQCVAPMLVVASASLGGAIFSEAALSFLGLGIPPGTPSWGNLLGGVLVESLQMPWWLVAFPGIAITLTILAFNLFGDGLRDFLDPKLRGRLD
jgi:ABC-type dipeptide/oligopeptide/nickel transport system permease subunit